VGPFSGKHPDRACNIGAGPGPAAEGLNAFIIYGHNDDLGGSFSLSQAKQRIINFVFQWLQGIYFKEDFSRNDQYEQDNQAQRGNMNFF
jgi:hypothetical protein